jgi:hypothetical protein
MAAISLSPKPSRSACALSAAVAPQTVCTTPHVPFTTPLPLPLPLWVPYVHAGIRQAFRRYRLLPQADLNASAPECLICAQPHYEVLCRLGTNIRLRAHRSVLLVYGTRSVPGLSGQFCLIGVDGF